MSRLPNGPFPTLRSHRGYFIVASGELLFHTFAAIDHLAFTARHTSAVWTTLRHFAGGLIFFGVVHAVVGAALLVGLAIEKENMRLVKAALLMSVAVWFWYAGSFFVAFLEYNAPLLLTGASLMGIFLSTAAFLEPPTNPLTARDGDD